MHKLNVFIKEQGLLIETELLSMAITGDRCIVLAQDRVAIAWLVVEHGFTTWVAFDNGLDLFADPRCEDGDECWFTTAAECDQDAGLSEVDRIEHSHCIKCTHDGTCQFQAKM